MMFVLNVKLGNTLKKKCFLSGITIYTFIFDGRKRCTSCPKEGEGGGGRGNLGNARKKTFFFKWGVPLHDTLTSLAEGTHGPRLANTTFIWIINLSNRYMTKQSARSALRSRSPLSSSTLTHSLSMKLPSKSLVSLIVRCKVFSSTIEPRASF